jgi:hypothetical protein
MGTDILRPSARLRGVRGYLAPPVFPAVLAPLGDIAPPGAAAPPEAEPPLLPVPPVADEPVPPVFGLSPLGGQPSALARSATASKPLHPFRIVMCETPPPVSTAFLES